MSAGSGDVMDMVRRQYGHSCCLALSRLPLCLPPLAAGARANMGEGLHRVARVLPRLQPRDRGARGGARRRRRDGLGRARAHARPHRALQVQRAPLLVRPLPRLQVRGGARAPQPSPAPIFTPVAPCCSAVRMGSTSQAAVRTRRCACGSGTRSARTSCGARSRRLRATAPAAATAPR